eukprot:TRINITY_DN7462_c4_g1_i1.p1 TRINITY_DN7462_c4_g1~~TRINITY_DN7462_c4_g1_i1.p1  ORF type:complete len:278 (+),score=33.50 TRINITY_DN7462_c4_g1_i1:2-835(+)
MKKRGIKFVGPTTCYSFMQGAGPILVKHTVFSHLQQPVLYVSSFFDNISRKMLCGQTISCKTTFCGQKLARVNVKVSSPAPLRKLTTMRSDLAAVATSYAGALVDLSKEKDALEAVHTDMDTLSRVLQNDEGLKEFLMNPVIVEDKKNKVLDKVASEAQFSPYTTNFLKLLIQKGRMEAILDIFEAFEVEYCKLTDTQVATVKSAVQLEQEQQYMIAKKLQELTGSKNVKLRPVIDNSLIGGFIVEYGSSQIDLSVKGQLDRITGELNELAASGALA